MIILSIHLLLTFVLSLHLLFLPLSKKRPILLEGVESAAFFALVVMCLTWFLEPYTYLFGGITFLVLLLSRYWLIIGVSKANIIVALNKAILASRSGVENAPSGYVLEKALRVMIYTSSLGGEKIHIVIFKNILYSKKAMLTLTIWRKFIQNFFL